MRKLITTSEQRCFNACQRKHSYRYVQLREAIYDNAMAAYEGTLGHCALEHMLLAVMDGASDPLSIGIEAMQGMWMEDPDRCPFRFARMQAAITGYWYRWKDEDLQVLAVERQYRIPLINPATGRRSREFDLGGKMDAIVRHEGKCLVMEHKFTSLDFSPGSVYWQRLRLDRQISAYIDGAAKSGYDVRGCLYDVIRRPTEKPAFATPLEDRKFTLPRSCKECRQIAAAVAKVKGLPKPSAKMVKPTLGCKECQPSRLYAGQRDKDETPSEYFVRVRGSIADSPDSNYQRMTIVRIGDELDQARRDTWATAKQITTATKNGTHTKNDQNCTTYNKLCSYFPVCSGQVSIEANHIYRDRPAKHSELEEIKELEKHDDKKTQKTA